jgi:hypothetical protein
MISIAKAATRARAPCLTLYLVRHAESMNNKINYDFREQGWGSYLRCVTVFTSPPPPPPLPF